MSYTVDVQIDVGTIEIFTEERDFAPEATVEPWDDSESARAAAAETRVELRGDTLYVRAPKTRRLLGRSVRVQVQIRTAVDSVAKISIAAGEVTCHGRLLDVRADTASGEVYLERAAGDVRFKSASGNLVARRIDGDLRMDTSSGQVRVEQLGGDAQVKGVSGEIEIGSAGAGVRVENVSGDIRLGPLSGGDVSVQSVSGRVSVDVVAGTGVWLDLQTTTGNTHSGLEDLVEVAPVQPDLTLRVRTLTGDIDVQRAAPQPATRTAS